MKHADLLSFYTEAGLFTQVDRFADEINSIPKDVAAIAGVVQGLLMHEALAPAYDINLPSERVAEKQLHSANAMLATVKKLNPNGLDKARAPIDRAVGVCRHFATLFVAILRSKGVPSRVRCGFANYFELGKRVDHWVGEYWHVLDERWVLVDAQVDDVQRKLFNVEIDTLDLPRDRFLVAGDAWKACRNGADAQTFGVSGTEMWG